MLSIVQANFKGNNHASTKIFILIPILILVFPVAAFGLNGADIAIYNDTSYSGGGAWPDGISAIKAMLQYYGFTYEDITPDQINSTSNLNSLYKVIIFGGGWAGAYNTLVNQIGFDNIRSFVEKGGGYFGICAGSYFASDHVLWKPDFISDVYFYDYPLNLFNGLAKGGVLEIKEWNAPTGCASTIIKGAAMTSVKVNNTLLPDLPSDLNVLYYGGPALFPSLLGMSYPYGTVSIVANYDVPGSPLDGSPAMIITTYGSGKVFLTGPHPEVSFSSCNLYYDSDAWKLMQTILSYLMS